MWQKSGVITDSLGNDRDMLVNDSEEAQESAVDRSVLAVCCRVLLQGSRVLRDVSASASVSMSVLQCVAVCCCWSVNHCTI